MPCAVVKSVEVMVELRVTLPNGVMLPVPVAEIVATGVATEVKLTFASENVVGV